jgi:hypothetical protein
MRIAKGFYGLGLAIGAALLLTGCGSVLDGLPGSGGGSDGGGGNSSDDPDKLADEGKVGTLSGIAKDGLVQNATVNVYAWNGSKGELLNSGVTDSKGKYSFRLQAKRQPILLEVVGGAYREEATATNVSLGNQDALYAVQNYVAGQPLSTAITYYTTLATGLAENLVKLGMEPAAAAEVANTRIGRIIGVDARSVMPTDIVEPSDVEGAELEYGFATAALSSLTERASVMNGAAPHAAAFTSIKFVQAAYDDVRADGILDGRGLNGDVVFGNIRLGAEIYRRELALHILRIANNKTANQTGITPQQLFDLAQRLNSSTDPIFGDQPVIPLDRDKPNVSALAVREFPNLTNGTVVFGGLNLSAMVVSFPGADRTELLLDDQVIAAAADPANPSLLLDTLNPRLAEGRHTLKLRVTDLSRAVGESPQLEVTVNNQQAAIANVSIEGKSVGSNTLVTVDVIDSARVTRVAYSVRAMNSTVFVPIAEPTFMAGEAMVNAMGMFDPSMFAEGDATFRVEATNSVGVTIPKDVPFIIDRTAPSVSIASPIVVDANQGQYYDSTRSRTCTPAQPAVLNDTCLLYARGSFNISADASDNRALDSVALMNMDAQTIGQPISAAGATSGTFDFTVDPNAFRLPDGRIEGERIVVTKAVDRALNSDTDSRRVVFDTTPPILLPPEDGATDGPRVRVRAVDGRGTVMAFGDRLVARGVVDITARVQDSVGLAAAGLFIDSTRLFEQVTAGTPETMGDQGTAVVSLSALGFDTARFRPDALHGFPIIALDRAGNTLVNVPGQNLVEFDNTAPQIKITKVVGNPGGAGSCAFTIEVQEPHRPITVSRGAQVAFRLASDPVFSIQRRFENMNGTQENKIPVQLDQNAVADVIVFLDNTVARPQDGPQVFEIFLFFSTRDGLGNTESPAAGIRYIANVDTRVPSVTCTPG